MADVYRCLDEGGVGVFESPTGTGKSLSLICSTMRWLLDQEQKDADALVAPAPPSSSGGDPSWVQEQTAASVQQQRSQAHTELLERRRLRAARVAAYDAADRASGGGVSAGDGARGWAAHAGKRGSAAEAATGAHGGPESEFLVEWSGAGDDPAEALLDPSLLLDRPDTDEVDAPRRPQVFYSSRTHSQLAQVVGEVKKTGYKGSVAVVTLGSRKNLCINDALRGLEGARLNEACLDLQDKASKERKAAAADGSSSDAEQSGKGRDGRDSATVTKSKRRNEGGRHEKKRGGCPHLAGGEARQARVLDRLLVSPLEIEELAELGRRENACPYVSCSLGLSHAAPPLTSSLSTRCLPRPPHRAHSDALLSAPFVSQYAARAALPEAQLVALPYASLLSSSTRQALGLRLAGSVVVIDEAHNLIDTINEMHSVTLTARHLSETSAQLAQYEERYRARLKPTNRQMVQQLLFVVRALRRALLPRAPAAAAGSVLGRQAQGRPPGAAPLSAAGSSATSATVDERIVAVNSLLCSLNVDHINLLRLKAFCESSELAKKLQGFSRAQVQVRFRPRLLLAPRVRV
jgi:chromosome transmission fidelity protein 1